MKQGSWFLKWVLLLIRSTTPHSSWALPSNSHPKHTNATVSDAIYFPDHRRLNNGGSGAYLGLPSSSWMKPEQYSPSHHRAKAAEDKSGGTQYVAVILFGQTARVDTGSSSGRHGMECRSSDNAKQLDVASTQKERVFLLLKQKGFHSDLFLATSNGCGDEWANKLMSAYRPWIRAVRFDNCENEDGGRSSSRSKDPRHQQQLHHHPSGQGLSSGGDDELSAACHLKHGLDLYDRAERTTRDGLGSFVVKEGGGHTKKAYAAVLLVRTDLKVCNSVLFCLTPTTPPSKNACRAELGSRCRSRIRRYLIE